MNVRCTHGKHTACVRAVSGVCAVYCAGERDVGRVGGKETYMNEPCMRVVCISCAR